MRLATVALLLTVYLSLSSACKRNHGGRPTYDANSYVTISISETLFIDLPNSILIRSRKPISKVTVEMQVYGLKTQGKGSREFDALEPKAYVNGEGAYLYELQYYVPIELPPRDYFELAITYFYCPTPTQPGCSREQLVAKSVTKNVHFVSRYTAILGETDKPLYRPGETVRYRFLALTSHDILPSTQPRTWPQYRAVGQRWGQRELERIDVSSLEKRTQVPSFDSVVVKDNVGNIVSQLENVTRMNALNLSFPLLRDSSEGEWQIVATVMESSEVLTFQVRHYVLPRFQAHVEVPKTIQLSDSTLNVSVCAAYTNGPAMKGTYDAQVCVCSRDVLEKQESVKKLLPRDECTSGCDWSACSHAERQQLPLALVAIHRAREVPATGN